MFKPKLSQIDGGVQLRSDVDTLQKSYDAAKVTTTVAKDDKNKYNADELLGVLKAGVDGVQGKVDDAINKLKAQKVSDYVRVQLHAAYDAQAKTFSVTLPDDLATVVPDMEAEKAKALTVYTLDNKVVLGADGNALTIDLSTGTFSSVPSQVDLDHATDGALAYKPLEAEFDFKVFPVGHFTFGTLAEDYLLDNNEFQTAIYGQAIEQIVGELAADDKVHESLGQKVTEDAITIIVKKTTDPIQEALDDHKAEFATHKALTETYVKEAGLDANSKKVVNVADGELVADSKDAINAGQLFAVDAAYKAADTAINKTVADNKKAFDNYKAFVDGYVKEAGFDANSKVIANVADGAVAENNKEAVNGGQLFAESKKLSDAINTLEADAKTNHTALFDKIKEVEKTATDSKELAESLPGVYVVTGINILSGGTVPLTKVVGSHAKLKTGDTVIDIKGDYYTVDNVTETDFTVGGAIPGLSLDTSKIEVDKNTNLDAKLTAVDTAITELRAAKVKVTVPVEQTKAFDLAQDAVTEFILDEAPNASKITVNVNGFVYEEDAGAFTVDRAASKVTWTFAEADGGFDLKADVADKVVVRYFVDKEFTSTAVKA